MMNNQIDTAVFEGIRKTISRFRRKPFHYFTEADIHSSLLNDITRANPHEIIYRPDENDKNLTHLKHISVALVHQEYPTNFRYKREDMTKVDSVGIVNIDPKAFSISNKTAGRRGNFDLVILKKDFIKDLFKGVPAKCSLIDALETIINKNINTIKEDITDSMHYAIEVKFLHPSNANNISMLNEILIDDHKLYLASKYAQNLRTINLVFCSTSVKKDDENAVINKVKDYISKDTHRKKLFADFNVLTIFIESFIDPPSTIKGKLQTNSTINKSTPPPIHSINPPTWATDLIKLINAKP